MTVLIARPPSTEAAARKVGHTDRVSEPTSPSDQELIHAAATGDASAFETLYRRHRDWVYSLAWRFTQDADLAADVTQEAFAYIVRRLPNLTLTAKLTTLLYPLIRHESQAALRKRRRFAPNPPEQYAIAFSTDDDLALRVRNAVVSLGESHAEIILLRYVHDMELHDIAEALNLPLGTVKSRLHRAQQALANALPELKS